MDGAGRQHYLAGHDRLEAPVHQVDANRCPRDRYATDSARLLGILDERIAGRDRVMGADFSMADISLLGWVRNLIGFYEARELVGFDRFCSRAGMARPRSRGAARAASDGGLRKVCLR
jgi:GST-like protein